MIKKILYFGSPVNLSCKDSQLIVEITNNQLEINFFQFDESDSRYLSRRQFNKKIPIEDIGMILLDHYSINVTSYLLNALSENNASIVICNMSHLPSAMMLNLDSHILQSEKFRNQINASLPLKKNLWQQTVRAKIRNQAKLLEEKELPTDYLVKLMNEVKSGDTGNCEAQAARYYWDYLFYRVNGFIRSRTGPFPNNILNYGYAILRAITARSLCGSGLLPTLGIHHRNKYNAYCLADDIMEPFRPFVDNIVCQITDDGCEITELDKFVKQRLLEIPSMDVTINKESSPLMVAMQRTTASLSKCFDLNSEKILYPEFEI